MLIHGRRGRTAGVNSHSQSPPAPTTPSPPTTMFRSTIAKSLVNASPRASRLAARPVLARAYHEKVISHYEQPRNVRLDQPRLSYVFGLSDNSPAPLLQVGSLNKNDPMVGTGLVGAPAYVPRRRSLCRRR